MSLTLNIQVHRIFDRMPDVDADILIFDSESPIGQLGAYIGDYEDGPMWVDSHGGPVFNVTHWSELPRLDGAV